MNFLHKKAHLIKKEDIGLLALYKPEGILSHPNSNKDISKSLINLPYDFKEEAYIAPDHKVYVLHRLDSATSGLILLSLNKELAQLIKKAFLERKVKKTYHALVKGVTKGQSGLWVDHLNVSHQAGKLRTEIGRGPLGKTHWKALWSKNGTTYLELNPLTGFTHQLRVQCAAHNLPIIGDRTYGDFQFNKKFIAKNGNNRLHLHASKVALSLEFLKKTYSFEAVSQVPF